MARFKHLTLTDRQIIEKMLLKKVKVEDIAKYLGFNVSTIYREIKKGLYDHLVGATYIFEKRYCAELAHEKYRRYLKDKGREIKLGHDYAFCDYVEKRIIKDKLSPAAVLGEIKRKGLKFDCQITVNTLYKYIEKGYFLNLDIKHLPRKLKKKKRKRKVVGKKAPKGVSIERRPAEISDRNSFGHWEMDCVCGPTKTSLLVLTERLTRKEIIIPIENQRADSVVKALNKLERTYGKNFKKVFKTITVDNGVEFSDYIGMQKSIYGKNNIRTKVFYCHPYSSYERGSNERLNREIRRLIPKGTNLAIYSKDEIQNVENWLNNYPRRILNYMTSQEAFEIEYCKLRL